MAAPKGFTTRKYPDVESGKDVDQYVCDKCQPEWDTFSLELAQAHAEADLHNEIGKPWQTVVPGQEQPA